MRISAFGLAIAIGFASRSAAAIVGGTLDTGDPAVVALLASDGQGSFSACSGTVVQVANGVASVLTAATCCNSAAPTLVVTGDDYSVGENYLNNPSSAVAPAYPVIASSVQWDPRFNPNASTPIDDFCMLRFNAPAGTSALAVATGSDGLAVGTGVTYVGFGTTSASDQTSSMRHKVTTHLASLSASTMQSSSTNQDACLGDTGGPVLLGSSVVGTIAYGDSSCSQFTVSMRATSETGPGGFIQSYLAAAGGGAAAPAMPPWALSLLAAWLCGLALRWRHSAVPGT